MNSNQLTEMQIREIERNIRELLNDLFPIESEGAE